VALELLVRQSRWHHATDANVELNANGLGMLEADVVLIKQKIGLQERMEPGAGIEPATSSLQNWRSTN
jgi:hypothetical protein